MTHPTGWPTAQSICDIAEVRKLIDAFAEDANDENMLAMVSAIIGHAPASVRAAALEEAAKWIDARLGNFMSQYGYDDSETGTLEFGRGAQADAKREYVGELQEIAEGIRALSAAPAGGLVDPIIATWPAEIWLSAGDEPLAPFDEHSEITWCSTPQGEHDVRYVRAPIAAAQGEGK